YFSATVLGAYTLAYRLMLFPIQSLTSVIMRSLYPLLSRNQDNPNLIKTTYLKVLTFIASITAPMMAGLVVLREPFVTAVFGGQWALVPAILLWLGPTGFIQSLISTTGSIFMAHGKTKLLMILGAFSAVLQVSAFIIGSKYNVQVIACLYFIANVLNAIPALYYTMKLIRGSYFQLIKRLVPPLLC
ncbi:oligosaccharide flippase family protein, partial [Escherichia coli]